MKKLPCINCICLAACRAKNMSQVVKCENITDFLKRPFVSSTEKEGAAYLSDGSYVVSYDWDVVCDYLGKPENKIRKDD